MKVCERGGNTRRRYGTMRGVQKKDIVVLRTPLFIHSISQSDDISSTSEVELDSDDDDGERESWRSCRIRSHSSDSVCVVGLTPRAHSLQSCESAFECDTVGQSFERDDGDEDWAVTSTFLRVAEAPLVWCIPRRTREIPHCCCCCWPSAIVTFSPLLGRTTIRYGCILALLLLLLPLFSPLLPRIAPCCRSWLRWRAIAGPTRRMALVGAASASGKKRSASVGSMSFREIGCEEGKGFPRGTRLN